jgi:hypothetical protein
LDTFALFYRIFALGLVVYWLIQIVHAFRQPPDWRPRRSEGFPLFVITRNRWILAGALGIAAGFSVFAWSFVVFR